MLKYYFEKQFKVFKLEGKLHEKIILYKLNYVKHIKVKHPEINIRKIIDILKNPDYIYKTSNRSLDFYYEKHIENSTFRVVITRHKPYIKKVVTAYKINNNCEFDVKHIICIYDKKNYMSYEEVQIALENDVDYFLELFDIVKD